MSMRITECYSHLDALNFLKNEHPPQYAEIIDSIESVNANQFLKISGDDQNLGKVYYSQTKINMAIKEKFLNYNWSTPEKTNFDIEVKNEKTTETSFQMDFLKDKIAVEVQLGKYSFVTYDLHVKHAYYFSQRTIEVLVEIMPMKAMEKHMDTGVPWFEKEINNLKILVGTDVNDPPVPVLVLGIQPDIILSFEPNDYSDDEIINILGSTSDRSLLTLKNNVKRAIASGDPSTVKVQRATILSRCIAEFDRQQQE